MKHCPLKWSAIVVLALLAACGSPDAGDPGVIRAVVTGGTYARAIQAAYFDPFTAETGIEFEIVPGGDDPEATLRVQAAAGRTEFDLIELDYSVAGPNLHLLEEHGINYPDDVLIDQPFKEKLTPNHLQAAYLIVCDRSRVARCPKNFAEYLDDETFPGDRSMPNVGRNDTEDLLANALRANGVAEADLYPLDLDRAFAKLASVRDSVRVFWTSSSGSQDVIRSGEAPINLMTDGRALQLVHGSGLPLDVSYAGAQAHYSSWAIPLGARNRESARRFMAWVLDRPEQQARLASLTHYGPATRRGVEAAARLGVRDHSGLHLEEMRVLDAAAAQRVAEWLAQHGEEMMERWNDFVGG
jgi:putative spermidine/putrescine transport system substrate-binding protein